MDEKSRHVESEVERMVYEPISIAAIPKRFRITSLPFFLTFAVGLGLGLVIHPPDQHEAEKGYALGFAAGSVVGIEEGRSEGHLAGITDGHTRGLHEGSKGAWSEANIKIAGMQTELNNAQSAVAKFNLERETIIEAAEETARRGGYAQGMAEKNAEIQKIRDDIEKTKKDQAEFLAAEIKKARREGEQSAGFEKWYNDGLKEGIDRATKDCEIAKGDAVDVTREAAKQQGYETGKADGLKAGEKAGKASGYQTGLAQGREEGETIGYKRGYKDGKEGRRSP